MAEVPVAHVGVDADVASEMVELEHRMVLDDPRDSLRHIRAEDRGRDRGMVPRPDEVTDVMEQRGHHVLDRASVA
jgi:hypothetical protein